MSGRGLRALSLPTEAITTTLHLDTNSPLSLTTDFTASFGGGSVTISNFTGSVTVSVLPVPNDAERATIRIEGGTFDAPSFRMPSGLETGPNRLTFGPPSQSGGILQLTNGSYTAYASPTITNALFPEGIRVRGNYSGVYNAATGRTTVQSQSSDSFKADDRLGFVRSRDGLQLTWSRGLLEQSTNLLSWSVISNAVSPFPVDAKLNRQFFRLRVGQS